VHLLLGYQEVTRLTSRDWNIKGEDIYELFGRYGGIRQVRIGTDQKLGTKGTAYIVSHLFSYMSFHGQEADIQVYESPDDAKEAITHLNGFNFSGRYIVGKLTPTVPSGLASA
jgi:pre-mRNA branch site protein p14